MSKPSVAIIVPFRIQQGQNRQWELQRFIPHMTSMMDKLLQTKDIIKYHIYVIEQHYEKKFNRGLLLNIGAYLCHKSYDTFIFHDVDLLPDETLGKWYSHLPIYLQRYGRRLNICGPIHIASCWKDRYIGESYFGGIVSFHRKMFQECNGFPNTFWGWGGEDDALLKRCKENNFDIQKVRLGSIRDIETDGFGNQMNLQEKLDFLKKNKEWKCHNKWEMKHEDITQWMYNGLCNVHRLFNILDFETSGDMTKIHVQI